MTFGERVRELRQAKNLTLRDLAGKVKVNFTYLSKIENHRLDFGDYPGEGLIRKLAKVLGADEDELLLLAEKVPDEIRRRVVQRPDAFRKLARLDDKALDRLVAQIDE
jgi:HTH-type transcriptional regulator, competence development regulator